MGISTYINWFVAGIRHAITPFQASYDKVSPDMCLDPVGPIYRFAQHYCAYARGAPPYTSLDFYGCNGNNFYHNLFLKSFLPEAKKIVMTKPIADPKLLNDQLGNIINEVRHDTTERFDVSTINLPVKSNQMVNVPIQQLIAVYDLQGQGTVTFPTILDQCHTGSFSWHPSVLTNQLTFMPPPEDYRTVGHFPHFPHH